METGVRGMGVKHARRLIRLVADLTLDNAILKEATGETSEPVTEAEGGDLGLRMSSDLPTAGMQGAEPGSIHSAA
jgi:hypothetical protein